MSYQLKTDEVMEALQRAAHSQAAAFIAELEALTWRAATALATKTGTVCGEASFEGVAFAGTCVPFFQAAEGQPLPECMEGYDNPEEWEDSHEGGQ